MEKIQTLCLITLATIASGFSLYYLQSVLLPFVIALFIVIGCRPVLAFLEHRLKLPRLIAFGVTFLVGVVTLAAIGFVIWASINDVSRNAGAYEKRLGTIATWVSQRMEKMRQRQQRNDGGVAPLDTAAPDDATRDRAKIENDSQAVDPSRAMEDLLDAFATQLQTVLLKLIGSLSTLMSYGVLILIFVFFLLIADDENHRNQPDIVREVDEQIRRFLVMKTTISFFTGLAFGLVLWMFGVPLAVVFGFLAFLLNFIPNIGPLVAVVLPVPFLILNSEMGSVAAVSCLILISGIQFVSGNVIETRLMGRSFDVSPVVLLMALMFFGLVWGIVGMFLATPIVSIIKIVLQQNLQTRPVAELMAGRWSRLSTSES